MFEIFDLFAKEGNGGGVDGRPIGGGGGNLAHGGDVPAQATVLGCQRGGVAKGGRTLPSAHIRAQHGGDREDSEKTGNRKQVTAEQREKQLPHAVFPVR